MKRSFLIIISLCVFNINLFSYPQAELGLISNYNLPEKRMASLNQGPLRHRRQERFNLTKEKREDGSDSLVFKVEHLPQFLFLSTMQSKPVVVGFFSDKDDTFLYQDIADKLKESAVFISVYPKNSPDFAKLFAMIFKFEGIDPILTNDKNYPFFVFCDKDFVLMQDKTVSFKKNSIKLLGKPGIYSENELLLNLNKNVGKISLNQNISTKNEQKQQEKPSFWQHLRAKFKNWIKSN